MYPPDRFDTEPVIGWRVWYVTHRGDLVSPQRPLSAPLWPQGERYVAECRLSRATHEAPCLECRCGIYCMKEPLAAAIMYNFVMEATYVMPNGLQPVLGQVALWGLVLEHEGGWRGQYAYPHMLRTPHTDTAAKLRNAYGVDVEATLED